MSSEYVQNELLTYAFDFFDRDSSVHLKDLIVNFYNEDDAVDGAKTLINLKYKDQQPKFQDRRNKGAKRG